VRLSAQAYQALVSGGSNALAGGSSYVSQPRIASGSATASYAAQPRIASSYMKGSYASQVRDSAAAAVAAAAASHLYAQLSSSPSTYPELHTSQPPP
jgi:hypothetical protein